MRKKLLKALIVCMLFTMPVNAAKMINCDISADGAVTIEQKLPSLKEGADVSIIVYGQGKSASDITDDNNALVSVIETNQTVSGKDGKYSFSFNITGESDFYTANIFSAAGDAEEYSFLYSKPEAAELFLGELNNSGSDSDFFKVIYGDDGQGENWKDLGFYYSAEENADLRKVSDLLFLDVKENGSFDIKDAKSAVKRFRQMFIIQLLNEGKLVSADETDKYFDDVISDFSEYYSKEYITSQVKTEIYKGLLNKNLKGKDDFKNKFLKQLILKTVLYADGYGNVRDILKEFETETGISTDELSNENYKNVIGRAYDDYDKLEEALNQKPTSGGSGGGGGGGGSASSKGKDNAIIDGSIDYAQELVETETVKPIQESKKHKFADTENMEWAEEAISVLADKGVITGKADNRFAPLDMVTREEFTAMIVRALNIKGMSENPFADVADDAWYAPFIKTAVNNSIINGVDGENFGVGQNITRQDVATIISRVKKSEATAENKKFLDDDQISDYAKDAVYAMYSENIISGYETGEFRPKSFATRAEAAVMLWRAFYR